MELGHDTTRNEIQKNTFVQSVLSNDMSYYLYQIKWELILCEYEDKQKLLPGLLDINRRETGRTGEQA